MGCFTGRTLIVSCKVLCFLLRIGHNLQGCRGLTLESPVHIIVTYRICARSPTSRAHLTVGIRVLEGLYQSDCLIH